MTHKASVSFESVKELSSSQISKLSKDQLSTVLREVIEKTKDKSGTHYASATGNEFLELHSAIQDFEKRMVTKLDNIPERMSHIEKKVSGLETNQAVHES